MRNVGVRPGRTPLRRLLRPPTLTRPQAANQRTEQVNGRQEERVSRDRTDSTALSPHTPRVLAPPPHSRLAEHDGRLGVGGERLAGGRGGDPGQRRFLTRRRSPGRSLRRAQLLLRRLVLLRHRPGFPGRGRWLLLALWRGAAGRVGGLGGGRGRAEGRRGRGRGRRLRGRRHTHRTLDALVAAVQTGGGLECTRS